MKWTHLFLWICSQILAVQILSTELMTISAIPTAQVSIAGFNWKLFSVFKIVFQSMFFKNRPLANLSSPNISSFVKKTILGRDNFDRSSNKPWLILYESYSMTHKDCIFIQGTISGYLAYVIIPQRSTYNSCWSFWNWHRQYCWWIFWRSIWKNQLDVHCFRLVFWINYASQLLACYMQK